MRLRAASVALTRLHCPEKPATCAARARSGTPACARAFSNPSVTSFVSIRPAVAGSTWASIAAWKSETFRSSSALFRDSASAATARSRWPRATFACQAKATAPTTSAAATADAARTPPRWRLTNLPTRYAAPGGAATTGSPPR